MWKVKIEVAVPVFLALPNQALSSESQLQEVLRCSRICVLCAGKTLKYCLDVTGNHYNP